jgi:hypothetical protein
MDSRGVGQSGGFKIETQAIRTVEYADKFVLLAKEEGTVLHGTIHRLIEIGRCCGMEMNVEKN